MVASLLVSPLTQSHLIYYYFILSYHWYIINTFPQKTLPESPIKFIKN
ncbi:hypothetical protein FM106_12000 [Brachybacterium faecium]|nr:hypothetical protein FM106_12000 [Brachybacterium faecium]